MNPHNGGNSGAERQAEARFDAGVLSLRRSPMRSSSSSSLHSSPSVRTLANPTGETSLSKLLLRKQQQQQEQQQQQAARTLVSSASTPGLRVAPMHTPSSPSPAKLHRPASSVAFAASPSSPLPVTHALSILPPMSPPPIVRPAAVAFARREESKDHSDGDDGNGDEADGSAAGDFDMSSLSLASGSEVNLAEGIDLLESNLLRLLPNALVRSGKYKAGVTQLIKALRLRANQAHGESKARKAALEAALFARSVAEASEARYRASIHNLSLDSWGNTAELTKDIRALEEEIIKRGRSTVEDTESVGVGLQFGIESDTAPTTSVAASGSAAGATSSPSMLLKGRGETVAMVTETASLGESTSKLVYTKYKRLEQLIYLLRRRLATLENYPSQKLIEAKFGSLENLLASQAKLEAEVERLESRLATQRIQFQSDALLRTRNLNAYPVPFLHLLIVSLQSSLASYTSAWSQVMGFAKDAASGLPSKHPLYNAFRTWSAQVERESRKMDVASSAPSKKLTEKRSATAAGPVGVLPLHSVQDKLDVDELWASISAATAAKEGAMSKRGASGSNHATAGEHKDGTPSRALHPAAGSSSSAAATSSPSSDLSAAAALSVASSKISALEFELGLLRKENKTLSWMQGILAREGFISNRSGTDLSPALRESVQFTAQGEVHAQRAEEEDGEEDEQQIEIISSTRTLGGSGNGDHEDEDTEESGDRIVVTPPRRLDVAGADSPSAGGAADVSPDSPPPTMLRAITITAPRPRDLVSPKGVAQGNNGMGSMARQASMASAAAAGSKGAVSTISRSLLAHLQHYVNELREYKRHVLSFQHMHAAREATLARSEADRWTLEKCMMMLLKKYPAISEGGPIGGSNSSNGSARGAGAGTAHGPGGSSSRLVPGAGGAAHLGISRQASSASQASNATSGSNRSDRSKGSSLTR